MEGGDGGGDDTEAGVGGVEDGFPLRWRFLFFLVGRGSGSEEVEAGTMEVWQVKTEDGTGAV